MKLTTDEKFTRTIKLLDEKILITNHAIYPTSIEIRYNKSLIISPKTHPGKKSYKYN
jgi:hypothetical protein